MPPTWLIILAVVIFIAGAVLLGYGLVKHEDKNEKTTTHKVLIGVGVLFILFGLAIILWAIISKFTQKPKPKVDQMAAPAVPEYKPMLPRAGYNASTPIYNPNIMYQPNNNMNMDFNANQLAYSGGNMPFNYPMVQPNMNPYPQYQFN
jgi:hypothetical protein